MIYKTDTYNLQIRCISFPDQENLLEQKYVCYTCAYYKCQYNCLSEWIIAHVQNILQYTDQSWSGEKNWKSN